MTPGGEGGPARPTPAGADAPEGEPPAPHPGAVGRLLSRLPASLRRRLHLPDDPAAGPALPHPATLHEHQRRIIEGVLRLDEARAWDVMTPRVDVFAWPARLTLAEIAVQLHSVRYSRVPVYGATVDDVTGVLYVRDAYQALVSGQRDVTLGEIAREALLVPGSVPLSRLLRDFQTRRIHMGVVIDEYGGTDGLVTLEDILEELVGDIVDETDEIEQPVVRVSRNEALVEGWADLREINHRFNTTFPQLEHRSFNGWVLDELGHVPRPGEELLREGVRIHVLEATDTQVVRARLTRPPPGEAPAAGDPAAEAADG